MKVGHVHLKVRDLDRALGFYRDILGLKITERLGDDMVFLTFGDAHHDVALQSVGHAAPAASPRSVGLYHTAFEVGTEAELRTLAKKLADAGFPGAGVDHGISHAYYTADPDGNGVEIYRDTRGENRCDEWHGRSSVLKI